MAKLLLGKEVTAAMNEKLQARVAALKEKGVSPKLAIVRCGENPSDLSYEKGATAARRAHRRGGSEVRPA
ncbi:MAG: tetrahydrofolate dehydrogenase/cyclohydrolase catalytic domain-containing protein [Oscillospiraceae bacterium]